MAAIATASISIVAAAPSAAVASSTSNTQSVASFSGLRKNVLSTSSFTEKTVSNGSRVSCMKVWSPIDNKKFETLSYLPPLTADQILKEVDYLLANSWVPAIEFDATAAITRTNNSGPGYYDGRYWTMWKLPMFGCKDSAQVLQEVEEAKAAYPDAFIRVIGFDNIRQVQCVSFIVAKP